MSPRPILKSLPTAPVLKPTKPSFRLGRVHFPPTPDLSATYLTHSERSYDRSAIVVSPSAHTLGLPERNCPDRTYVLSEGKGEARLLKTVEPADMQADEDVVEDGPAVGLRNDRAQQADYFSVTPPSLTPDMTSESEDSDELMSPSHEVEPILGLPLDNDHDISASAEHVEAALAFLPHPLPPVRERKRSLSPHDHRRRERAYSLPGEDSGFGLHERRRRASFTTDLPPDSGCLGGF